jgi:hypothetical protein
VTEISPILIIKSKVGGSTIPKSDRRRKAAPNPRYIENSPARDLMTSPRSLGFYALSNDGFGAVLLYLA